MSFARKWGRIALIGAAVAAAVFALVVGGCVYSCAFVPSSPADLPQSVGERSEVADGREGKVAGAHREYLCQAPRVAGAVRAVPALRAGWLEEPHVLVMAQRACTHACHLGKLAHAVAPSCYLRLAHIAPPRAHNGA